jgi:hypothetical protein
MDSKKYAICNVSGDGKLYTESNNNADNFKIIDMSAEGIRIETSAELHEQMVIKLKIRLKGSPIDAHIDVNGKVKGKLEKGFEIEFLDLLDSDRDDIDELMRNACNIE